MKKTLGTLIDELSVTNIKIFFLIDKVHNNTHTREEAKQVQDLNRYRSELMGAINEFFGERKDIKV